MQGFSFLSRYTPFFRLHRSVFHFKADVVNRNPRNLEQMGLSRKRKGWEFQMPNINYYNKCILKRSGTSTIGQIVFGHENEVFIEASTAEKAISRHLYSSSDVCAAANVGRVLARRCLQSGLHRVYVEPLTDGSRSERLTAFRAALLEGGIQLDEANEPDPPAPHQGVDYRRLSLEQLQALRPTLLQRIKDTPDDNETGREPRRVHYPYSLRPCGGDKRFKTNYQILSKVRRGLWWNRRHRLLMAEPDQFVQHQETFDLNDSVTK